LGDGQISRLGLRPRSHRFFAPLPQAHDMTAELVVELFEVALANQAKDPIVLIP
jgi:hypothetical protein